MRQQINRLLRPLGFELIRYNPNNPLADLSPKDREILARVAPFTMTSPERLASLIYSVGYISTNQIAGDIAECGVWRGGSMMAVALALLANGDTTRSLYLYDTFEGMTPPSAVDTTLHGRSAKSLLQEESKGSGAFSYGIWCYASIEDVRRNILSTGYPEEKVHFIKGKVEDTIPHIIPSKLSLLRLDTDWYESTTHELTHLFPLLSSKGVLIIDDYGAWQGAKKAVDEYFQDRNRCVYLHRIDFTGRVLVGGGDE